MFLFSVRAAIFIKYQRKPCKSRKAVESMLRTPLPEAKQPFLSNLFSLLIFQQCFCDIKAKGKMNI